MLGVTEKPSRFGHPAFKYIATAGEIIEPGYPTDGNYVSDLLYLPYRQIRLFAASVLPGGTGLDSRFDPSRYPGPSVDATGNEVLPDGRVKEGEKPASMQELMRGVHKLERGMHPPILPARYADLEFGDERHYVREICDLARAKGVKVAFLFLPYYTGPDTIQESRLYEFLWPDLECGVRLKPPRAFRGLRTPHPPRRRDRHRLGCAESGGSSPRSRQSAHAPELIR